MGDLAGHSIVVTGAGRGMGAAYARGAAALGASIVVNDIDGDAARAVVEEIAAAGGAAVAEARDIRDPSEANAAIARCIGEFGRITGLVNNAAIHLPGLVEETTVEDLRAMLDVNVVGLFNMSRAAIGPMLAQGRGSIVNVTSGAQTGQPRISLYGASKGAVSSLTYGWAGELRDRGVRVNAVSPMAATQMSNYAAELPAPEDNVPPVLFLLSDLSAGVTGQMLRITGKKLSLMCHPAIRAPVLERDLWTLDGVADAFATSLAQNQVPTNVAIYDIASVRLEAAIPNTVF